MTCTSFLCAHDYELCYGDSSKQCRYKHCLADKCLYRIKNSVNTRFDRIWLKMLRVL
jgi:hypothetical protein